MRACHAGLRSGIAFSYKKGDPGIYARVKFYWILRVAQDDDSDD